MPKAIPFIGRQQELTKLRQVADNRIASLIVLKGRRRIGKTRLAEEFGKNFRTLMFAGLPPAQGITAQVQRDHLPVNLPGNFSSPLLDRKTGTTYFGH